MHVLLSWGGGIHLALGHLCALEKKLHPVAVQRERLSEGREKRRDGEMEIEGEEEGRWKEREEGGKLRQDRA